MTSGEEAIIMMWLFSDYWKKGEFVWHVQARRAGKFR